MERYDPVVEDRAIATLRGQDAVLVPVMRFRHVGGSDPRQAFVPGVGPGMVMPGGGLRMDELTVERADRVPDQQEMGRARELSGDEQRGQDRDRAAPRSRRCSLHTRYHPPLHLLPIALHP
jgi:hypothetical protein